MAAVRFDYLLATALVLASPGPTLAATAAKDNRCAFIGFTDFSGFS